MGFSQLSLSSILPRLQSLLRGERKQEKYPTVYCQVVYYSTNLYKNSNLRTVSNEGPAEEARIVDSCRLSSFVVVVTTPEWLTIGIDAFVVAVWRRPVVFVVSR